MDLIYARVLIPACLVFLCGCAETAGIPEWVAWREKEETVPENPGLYRGSVKTEGRRLTYLADDVKWESDPAWLVSDFLIGDIDRDGWPEVLMTAWVKGQYGDQHPIWEDPRDPAYTQRLFVFDLAETGLVPQWMSSQMRPEYQDWELQDTELVLEDLDGRISHWAWQGRTFVRTDQ